MAISFVASASNSASPNATYQVALPTGSMVAGDLIIETFAVGDSPGADTNLSGTGLTEVADLAITTDTNDTELFVGYNYWNGTDTNMPTAAWTAIGGTNASNASVLMVFRGVASLAQGGPFDTTATTATGANTHRYNPPSIDHTGAAGIWTVIAAAFAYSGTGASVSLPTNYTTDGVERDHQDTVDVYTAMGYNSSPSDPEDPAQIALGGGTGTENTNSWCAVTMALKPAPPSSIAVPRRFLKNNEIYIPFDRWA